MDFCRTILLTMTLTAAQFSAGRCHAQNLFQNPGFESGNTGFASDYSFSSGGNCCEGQYTVRSNGSTFNGSFVNPPAASPGSSLMMVINGSTVPNQRVWWQRVAVTPGRTYDLSMSGCTAVAGGPAILQWQIGGVLLATPVSLPNVTREWVRIPGSWTAPPGVTEVEVAVRNLNTSTFPNDFYLDDMLMRERTCPADFNGDGFLDFFDYGDFVACFEGTCSPGITADFNGDGFVDFFDYDDFVGAFEAGC